MTRKRIVVIGAGGMAREIQWLLREINAVKLTYEFLGYVVSDLNKCGDYDCHSAILGITAGWKRTADRSMQLPSGSALLPLG